MWELVSAFNCPLCQIGDNKQFEATSCSPSVPPVAAAGPGRCSRRDLEAGCVCQGGKSPLWWGGKHYGQLYRHRLLWHIQKWPNKFAGWRWRDGRLWGRSGVTAQRQMFVWPPLLALQRLCCSVRRAERWRVIGLFTLNIQWLQQADALNTRHVMMPKPDTSPHRRPRSKSILYHNVIWDCIRCYDYKVILQTVGVFSCF